MKRLLVILLPLLIGCAHVLSTQTRARADLLAEINRIKAIDVHSHSEPAGAGLEDEEDLEPYLASLASTDPAMIRLSTNHPDYVLAWRALYGYAHEDMDREHVLRLLETKKQMIREKANAYPAWVLDHAGIETQFVFPSPLTRLGEGQTSPRFLCVAFATPLLYPFAGDPPDLRGDFLEDGASDLFDRAGVAELPPTLDAYTERVVSPTLERWKREGAVGLKFGIAYRRPLSFSDVPRDEASRIYEKGARAGALTATEYTVLQDYLFWFIARAGGHVGLPVFIHTGVGASDYFNISGSNPALLESVFNDPTTRKTQFIVVHGGWPYDKETGVMLQKPNVHADFSVQPLLRTTRALSVTLREWLEWAPEQVMFGTDAYSEPGTPLGNWEEKTWVATHAAREALAIALTEMIDDGEVTQDQALMLARMVLRENAVRLFGLRKE